MYKQKRMIAFFCAIIFNTPVAGLGGIIRYVEFTTQVELNCGCLSEDGLNKSKRWYKNGSLIKISKDDWGPLLVNNDKTLLVQSVRNLKKNITYECRVVQGDGSENLCKSYTVKAFHCRHHTETIEPQNVTNLVVGDSPVFTCKHYFACDKVNEDHSVSMRTKAKHIGNISCTISDQRLTHECKLQIRNITEEDFGKTVQCVVNDSGIIFVHDAFPIKREVNVIRRQLNVTTKIIIPVALFVLATCTLIIGLCNIRKQKTSLTSFPNEDQRDGHYVYRIFKEENSLPMLSSLQSNKKATLSDSVTEGYI